MESLQCNLFHVGDDLLGAATVRRVTFLFGIVGRERERLGRVFRQAALADADFALHLEPLRPLRRHAARGELRPGIHLDDIICTTSYPVAVGDGLREKERKRESGPEAIALVLDPRVQ